MIYHKSLGFPSSIVLPSHLVNLNYTRHALDRRQSKFNHCLIPTYVKVTWNNVVEIETEDNVHPIKIVIRIHYDKIFDMVLVLRPIAPGSNNAKVITLWLNKKKDQHHTLNIDKYDKPNETLNA